MTTLWIEEEPDIPLSSKGPVSAHDASNGNDAQQKITLSATSQTATHNFADTTRWITIHTDDSDCYFDLGPPADVEATTSTRHLVAGVYRTFKVQPGWNIAAKTNA